jgi:transcriptional regulator with XRE-family HTH domain
VSLFQTEYVLKNYLLPVEYEGDLRAMDRYDRDAMGLRHPIDQEVRERLRQLGPKQVEFARAIGRSQGWLNKYMNGAGTATIDDLIRIAAVFIGAEAPTLSATEQRLLRAWKQIPEPSRLDALAVFENHARFLRRSRARGSAAPAAQTPPAATSKARGRR